MVLLFTNSHGFDHPVYPRISHSLYISIFVIKLNRILSNYHIDTDIKFIEWEVRVQNFKAKGFIKGWVPGKLAHYEDELPA